MAFSIEQASSQVGNYLYFLPGNDEEREIVRAIAENDLNKIRVRVESGSMTDRQLNAAFSDAAHCNRGEIADYLLAHNLSSESRGQAASYFSYYGDAKRVEQILDKGSISNDHWFLAIKFATLRSHTGILNRLLNGPKELTKSGIRQLIEELTRLNQIAMARFFQSM